MSRRSVEDNGRQLTEEVVDIKRVSKKTRGGNRLGFTCLAVVGDENGRVGTALRRAPTVVPAIKKAMRHARKRLIEVPVVGKQRTIPHEIEVRRGGGHVLLKPAPGGTGIRAGGPVRVVLQVAGYENVVGKILGASSRKTNVDATLLALQKLKRPEQKKAYKDD